MEHQNVVISGDDKTSSEGVGSFKLQFPSDKCSSSDRFPNSSSKINVHSMIKRSYFAHFSYFDREGHEPDDTHKFKHKLHQEYNEIELQEHPRPRNQGPLLPFLISRFPNPPNWGEVMRDFCSFQHESEQECANWTPAENEEAGGDNKLVFNVTNVNVSRCVFGPCSNKQTMAMEYTCIFNTCKVGCPCQLCVKCHKYKCRRLCRDNPCPDCYPQCKVHKVLVDRRFDDEKDSVTIRTDSADTIKYVVKHAGIPKDCKVCAGDLLDHQQYHLLPHQVCKFCLQLLGPIVRAERLAIPLVTVKDFKKAKSDSAKYFDRSCG